MSKPSIAELSKNNKYNRYTLVMAAAKGARYVIAKENYEKEHPEYEQYKALTTGKKAEKTEEKPVMEAINMLYNGEMLIKTVGEDGELETLELSAKDKEMIAEQEKEAGEIEAETSSGEAE
ncbi:MAG: hypothetical protein ACOYIO_01940 [Eubacteriales bacterium]|jgi:DNA-directed RNA polymerase subunit K/omega